MNRPTKYNEKEPGATAADCIGCRQCEENCPQKLKIRDLLQMVDEKLTAL